MTLRQNINPMQCNIDREKLEEHRNDYPSYNWAQISGEIKELTHNFNKRSKRKFKNEWFMTTNVSVSFDCKQLPIPLRNWTQKERWARFGKMQSGDVEINLSELFKAMKIEKHQIIAAFGNAKGTVSDIFKYSYKNNTLKGHLTRYLKRLSKRKSTFLNSCIIMTKPVTTSSLGTQQNTIVSTSVQDPAIQPDNSSPMPTSSNTTDNMIDSLSQFASTLLTRNVPFQPRLPNYYSRVGPTIQSTATHQLNHPSQLRLVERDYEQELFTLTNALDCDDDEYTFSPIPFSYTN